MDTKEKKFDSEYGFRPRSNPCKTRFVGTHQHFTGAEHPSRIENNIYFYIQTVQFADC